MAAAITCMEEITCNAWPCLGQVFYDGWLLRFAGGYTRRANSVNPLYASRRPLDEKIRFCETTYGDRALPTVFKLTAASQPAGLDAALAARGYAAQARTAVQTRALDGSPSAQPAGALAWSELSREWLEAYATLNQVPSSAVPTLRAILASIVPERCFVALTEAERIVAVGLAVRQQEHVGLFDLVTAAGRRRQGLGTRLVQTLLAWGQARGAKRAYLQVMLDNTPALTLYDKLGFGTHYEYWYRVRR